MGYVWLAVSLRRVMVRVRLYADECIVWLSASLPLEDVLSGHCCCHGVVYRTLDVSIRASLVFLHYISSVQNTWCFYRHDRASLVFLRYYHGSPVWRSGQNCPSSALGRWEWPNVENDKVPPRPSSRRVPILQMWHPGDNVTVTSHKLWQCDSDKSQIVTLWHRSGTILVTIESPVLSQHTYLLYHQYYNVPLLQPCHSEDISQHPKLIALHKRLFVCTPAVFKKKSKVIVFNLYSLYVIIFTIL